jgi:hypothetical protein
MEIMTLISGIAEPVGSAISSMYESAAAIVTKPIDYFINKDTAQTQQYIAGQQAQTQITASNNMLYAILGIAGAGIIVLLGYAIVSK